MRTQRRCAKVKLVPDRRSYPNRAEAFRLVELDLGGFAPNFRSISVARKLRRPIVRW